MIWILDAKDLPYTELNLSNGSQKEVKKSYELHEIEKKSLLPI